jgi:hypothetical protein
MAIPYDKIMDKFTDEGEEDRDLHSAIIAISDYLEDLKDLNPEMKWPEDHECNQCGNQMDQSRIDLLKKAKVKQEYWDCERCAYNAKN